MSMLLWVSVLMRATDYVPYKAPWTQCPTTSSVRVVWQMGDAVERGVVYYGLAPDALIDSVVSTAGKMVEGEGYVHTIDLTGLQPFTRYYYTVGNGKRYATICSTKTAPNEGVAWRLFTISDIHGNSCQIWENMQDFVTDSLQPDLSVMQGDLVSDDGTDRLWNQYFFSSGKKFLSQVPVMSSIGNHETGVPQTYRWSNFYDYFWQFSHGQETDSIKDPRGEAYFSFPYGNALFICFDNTAEPAGIDFSEGSLFWNWLDETLNTATQPWIILSSHVGIHTTGYHGQWEDGQTSLDKLLEKYAARGKRILSLAGDDHSFEHLYKKGVHYLRPGCGRNSNYAQQTHLDDANYSMFYKQVSCYSTLDMAADASTIHLTARDSVGNVFYEYDFK